MKKHIFGILLLIGITVGALPEAQAQGRPRPRPVHRQTPVYRQSSNGYSDALGVAYKGFLELGYSGGVSEYSANQLDVLTTHGVTFGSNLFLGVGLGVNILYPDENGNPISHLDGGHYMPEGRYSYNKETAVMVPVYFDLKYNFGNGAVRPFVDVKLGAAFLGNDHAVSIGDGWLDDREGFYFSPTIGVNIPTSSRVGINIGVTYNLISQKYYYYDYYYDHYYSNDGISLHSLGVKFSIEW